MYVILLWRPVHYLQITNYQLVILHQPEFQDYLRNFDFSLPTLHFMYFAIVVIVTMYN